MSLVIDANLVAALVLPLPYSERVAEKIADWKRDGVQLCAPLLLEYEVASILRKAVVSGWMSTDAALGAMWGILALNIRSLPPTSELHTSALRWAERLGQLTAYDAHYLAAAEELGAELWTADRRLAHAAHEAGAAWVRWIEDPTTGQG